MELWQGGRIVLIEHGSADDNEEEGDPVLPGAIPRIPSTCVAASLEIAVHNASYLSSAQIIACNATRLGNQRTVIISPNGHGCSTKACSRGLWWHNQLYGLEIRYALSYPGIQRWGGLGGLLWWGRVDAGGCMNLRFAVSFRLPAFEIIGEDDVRLKGLEDFLLGDTIHEERLA